MTATPPWELVEPDLQAALRARDRPLDALASATIPAVVLRRAYPPEWCEAVYRKLLAEGLLYDPALPVPEQFLEASIPEGYYREGRAGTERGAWQLARQDRRRVLDGPQEVRGAGGGLRVDCATKPLDEIMRGDRVPVRPAGLVAQLKHVSLAVVLDAPRCRCRGNDGTIRRTRGESFIEVAQDVVGEGVFSPLGIQ